MLKGQTGRPFRSRTILFLLLAGLAFGGCQTASERPPDVVVILADDMGYSDIGSYGSEIRTPHLDRLAEQGLRFTRFYNAARCSPTRAALLTGLHPHQAGMAVLTSALDSDPTPGPYQGYLDEQSVTMAEALKAAAYRTYMSGKWHLGEKPEHWPHRRGFDRYFGLISGASSYFRIIKDQPRVRQMALDSLPWEPPPEGFYMTDAISDYAVRWVQEHQQQHAEQPFFMYVAYTAPHWPLHALPEDIDRYAERYRIGWDSLRAERFERMKELGIVGEEHTLTERPDDVPAWDEVDDQADWQRRMAVYAAMIDRMDQGVGRILQALDDAGRLENTVVLFLSDNGGSHEDISGRGLNDPAVPVGHPGSYVAYQRPWANASNTPFRKYKSWVHEGGIITPLIVHWPAGIAQPGRITDQVGHVTDLMATVLDLAGVTYPDSLRGHPIVPLQGQSLLPVFRGQQRTGHETLYWEHLGNRAIRNGPWKLVYDHTVGTWELYNMEADPSETNDLADQYPERVERLRVRWRAWADRVGVFDRPEE